MRKFKAIAQFIKENCELEKGVLDEEYAFWCKFRDKGYEIKVRITSELCVTLPHVDDFAICPACGVKHRNRKSLKTGHCRDCRAEKQRLMIKGISQRAMKDPRKYNELLGASSLLRRLKKAILDG